MINRVVNKLGSLFVLVGLVISAQAAAYDDAHWYAGLGLGSASYSDDNEFDGLSLDDSDSSGNLFAGYRIAENVAIELRLSNLGEYSYDFIGSNDVEYSAISGHGLLILPLGEGEFELFGQLGLGIIDRDDGFNDDTGGLVSLGGGLHWTPVEQFTFGVQLDIYAFTVEGLGGEDFDEGIGTGQLTVAYNFR